MHLMSIVDGASWLVKSCREKRLEQPPLAACEQLVCRKWEMWLLLFRVGSSLHFSVP